jgi:shikimate dehydrogenase
VPAAGRTALVLGAGGSARAAVHALLGAGAADVAVLNRTVDRARALVADLGGRVVTAPQPADLLVNCTSVGLDDPDATPLADLAGVGAVVDLVYREGATRLIRDARGRGIAAVDGLEVLVQQGARSFALWTGREPPLEPLREAARRPS